MKSSIYSETMDGNESITIYEASEFYDEVLDIGVYGGVGISVLVGSITMVGLLIKGIFIYYIRCAAPKERPINNMVFCDQVSQFYELKESPKINILSY